MNDSSSRMTYPERKVAEYLQKMNIEWVFEQPVFIWDDDGRPRVWTPDFYLIHFGIYLEVCGSEKFDYKYRRKIFDRNGYQVIFLHLYKESDKWINHLLFYLMLFSDYRTRRINDLLKGTTKKFHNII